MTQENKNAALDVVAKIVRDLEEMRDQIGDEKADLFQLHTHIFDLANLTSQIAWQLQEHLQVDADQQEPAEDTGKQLYYIAHVEKTMFCGDIVWLGEWTETNKLSTSNLADAMCYDQAGVDRIHTLEKCDSRVLLPIPEPQVTHDSVLVVRRAGAFFRELADAEAVARKKAKKDRPKTPRPEMTPQASGA